MYIFKTSFGCFLNRPIIPQMKIMASEIESTRNSSVDLVMNEALNAVTPNGSLGKEEAPKKTVIDLLKTPNMRARSLNLFFCW